MEYTEEKQNRGGFVYKETSYPFALERINLYPEDTIPLEKFTCFPESFNSVTLWSHGHVTDQYTSKRCY